MDDCFGDHYKEKESLTCTDTTVLGKKEKNPIHFQAHFGNGKELCQKSTYYIIGYNSGTSCTLKTYEPNLRSTCIVLLMLTQTKILHQH